MGFHLWLKVTVFGSNSAGENVIQYVIFLLLPTLNIPRDSLGTANLLHTLSLFGSVPCPVCPNVFSCPIHLASETGGQKNQQRRPSHGRHIVSYCFTEAKAPDPIVQAGCRENRVSNRCIRVASSMHGSDSSNSGESFALRDRLAYNEASISIADLAFSRRT